MNQFAYYTEPDDVYHGKAKDYVSAHTLAVYLDSPYQFKRMRDGLAYPPKENDAFAFGTAFHMAVLQPDLFEKTYIDADDMAPVNPKTGKPYGKDTNKYQDWLATIPKDKRILPAEDFTIISRMKDGISRQEDAKALLSYPFYPEAVIRQNMNGINCQSKLDYIFIDNGIVNIIDLKSTRSLKAFMDTIYAEKSGEAGYGYLRQAAFYTKMARQSLGTNDTRFYFIACEKEEPWNCAVVKITDQTLTSEIGSIDVVMERMKGSFDKNEWPTGYEDIIEI